MHIPRIVCFSLLLGAVSARLYAADITGRWAGKNDYGSDWAFSFKSDGGELTGTMISAEGNELPINDGKLDGDALSFSVNAEWQGQPVRLLMTGKVSGEGILLHIGTEDGSWGTDTKLKRASS